MSESKDLIGHRFNRLTVVEQAGTSKYRYILWLCKCDCGNTVVVKGTSLRSGETQSCGCLRYDRVRAARKKHGSCTDRLYRIWHHMKSRCNNPNDKSYSRYGGRGIKVCPEWNGDYIAFQEWAFANGYRDDLTLDRKENNCGYCPENCRWATNKEQGNNKRNSRLIEYNGETHTLSEWAEITGMPRGVLKYRLTVWDVEKAFTEPIRGKEKC